MKLPAQTKPWIQGAVLGSVATIIVGFAWGGWYTGGTYKKDVAAANGEGRVAALAPLCFAAVKAGPDFAKIKGASSWDRGNQIEKGGYANLPGTTTPDSDVARKCGEMVGA